jgi:hypothetical protein
MPPPFAIPPIPPIGSAIPPIRAIPAIPSIAPPVPRSATEPDPRPDSISDGSVEPVSDSAPGEFGDTTSTTNMSFAGQPGDDPAASGDPAGARASQIVLPLSTAPDSLPPPRESKQQAAAGPSPACPQCDSPMAWVDEHLRFYCRSCRMYF